MNKPRTAFLVAVFAASTNIAVFAQDSGYQYAGYQGSAPTWPQQAPQGYEAPQYDAYRGEAQMQRSPSGTNYNQPIQPESNSATRAVMEAQEPATRATDKPIKPDKINTRKIKGAVGGIGRTLGHLAMPVAGLGAMYMVTRAATRAGMMSGGYGMGGMGGMGGMSGMGGYGTRGYGW